MDSRCPDARLILYPLERSTMAVDLCSRFSSCERCRATWDGLGADERAALTDQIRRNAKASV